MLNKFEKIKLDELRQKTLYFPFKVAGFYFSTSPFGLLESTKTVHIIIRRYRSISIGVSDLNHNCIRIEICRLVLTKVN
jgi:hypothetical protein